MTAFPINPYFCLNSGKHDGILSSFMVAVSKLKSFSFVRMCQIDDLEEQGTENLANIRLFWRYRAETRGGEGQKIAPCQSRVKGIAHFLSNH